MNAASFNSILANPETLAASHTQDLQEIVKEYPYFQSAKALYLKALKNNESYLYNDVLKVTAAYTTDRSVLFEFITSDAFTQKAIAPEILELEKKLHDIYVVDPIEVTGYEIEDFSENEPVLDPDLFQPKTTTANTSPEEALGIGKPLPFEANERHSFNEWLQLTTYKPIDRTAEQPKQKKLDLIASFLEKKPKIKPPSKTATLKNLAEERTHKTEELMTETLAKVYLEQKNYNKAIQAYKILSLKYPEKSSFFADRIKEIKKLNK